MPAPERLLFTDTESTGIRQIDGYPCAVLEFAWTITDAAGEQVTPLNSVFTALPTEPGQDLENDDGPLYFPQHFAGHPEEIPTAEIITEESVGWGAVYPSPYVRDMHDTSGLTLEWVRADRLRPLSIVSTWAELERLIISDLLDAGWYDLSKASVQLAGDGVAHFEHTFLPTMAPRVFADPRFHYRTHDVSQVLHGLRTATGGRTPANVGEIIAAHAHEITEDGMPVDGVRWARIEIGPWFDATDRGMASGAIPMYRDAVRPGWVDATDVPHRAATDVARTLMAHRLLPRLVP